MANQEKSVLNLEAPPFVQTNPQLSDKKVTCVKHNEPVKFRMEECKTTLAGTFYCSTWNKAPGLRCGELH